jgi:hypothetical protein
MRVLALSVVALALVAPAPEALAQSTHPATAAAAPGPRASAARVGISPIVQRDVTATFGATRAPLLQGRESQRRSGQMLTIIGGGIFLAGLLIGDDVGTIVALGGLGLGIYGLLQWLQASATGLASP